MIGSRGVLQGGSSVATKALASVAISVCLLHPGCRNAASDTRPSIVVLVLDTVRSDALSQNGEVEGTTPVLDALAAESVVYDNAYSSSSWTLPSHATLLTGLGIDAHGVGTGGNLMLGEGVVTLAETLRQEGYETAAFSENMLVSDVFQMLQGFRFKRVTRVYRKGEGVAMDTYWTVNLMRQIEEWLSASDDEQPFLLFVNIFDAHSPYEIRDENVWVPEDASRARVERRAQTPGLLLCGEMPEKQDIDILEGLYLGDVRAADEKLGQILDLVRKESGSRELITLVTSDHGELFGERRILGHEFSLDAGVTRIPLMVHGLSEAPVKIDEPVSLLDVAPSVYAWTGVVPPQPLPGRPLPTAPAPLAEGDEARAIHSAFSDRFVLANESWDGVMQFVSKEFRRRACGPEDKVHGGMATLLRYPYRLHWFERYPPELYDLRWDPYERSDIAAQRPEDVAALAAELSGYVQRAALEGGGEVADELTPEAIEALRRLGYIE